MKNVIDVKIKKLKGEGSYYAHVEFEREKGWGIEEFHADDFRTVWDKITFWLLEREKEIEDII